MNKFSKSKKVLSLSLALYMSIFSVAPSLSFAHNNNVNNKEVNFKLENDGIKDVNILYSSDNYIEYTFKENNNVYLAKEYIKVDPYGKYTVDSNYYKFNIRNNKELVKKEKYEISKVEKKINVKEYDNKNNVINERNESINDLLSNYSINDNYNKNFKFKNRSSIQYGVYVYKRTIKGYRNISLKRNSLGVLAAAIASLSSGPVSAFFGIASFLIGTSASEVWTITNSLS